MVKMDIVEVDDASSWSSEEDGVEGEHLCLNPAEEEASEGEDGLSHHGDPGPEVEIIDDSEEKFKVGRRY